MITMKSQVLSTCLILLSFLVACRAQWKWANHGKPPVYTAVNAMQSGSNSKLFGVGNGNLQERIWVGSSWVWHSHGAPSGLWYGERLANDPCILTDGKMFIISNKGRLFERYWTGFSWAWAIHGKAMGTQNIRTVGCTCTTRAFVARVFVVGTNFRLYELYWSWSSSSWVWRCHGSPPGTTIGAAAIDSCNLPTCDTRVYVVGLNGKLYYRYITPTNPSWVTVGRPTGESVRSVSVSPDGIFITTYDNDICEYYSTWSTWFCYGKPSGSKSLTASLSKAYRVSSCAALPGNARYIFLYSWDPSHSTRGRLFSLKITGVNIPSWTYHRSIGNLYYIGTPEMFMNWNCPKVFVVRSNGYVYEGYV